MKLASHEGGRLTNGIHPTHPYAHPYWGHHELLNWAKLQKCKIPATCYILRFLLTDLSK